ncbi:nuclease [Streptomyces xiamenensis]|uniref:ParB domain protein nuclease n=1 Tax=Streptomyces xiamenensis TaxID=408015 RepID=A0A0F7FY54_9ACTN|nr:MULTISPECIES: ParB/RepB/Spo0J family partition protein [Streptomyces]AKG44975.1 ParB domain protein nuclease [Streptomyces xiamenensis]
MALDHGRTVLIAGDFGSVTPDADASVTQDGFDLKNFEQLPIRDVPVSEVSPEQYLRKAGTSATHVRLLVDAAGTSKLPPILVQEDGWRVIDGLHRLEAAKLRGDHFIEARFLDCTDSEALVLAMKANSSHGLPLSKADRVSGAQRVLSAHADWSDRAIAGITGLSAKTIASLRGRSTGAAAAGGKRLGRDGRRRPVASGEGRQRAAEYIRAHPDAPLRQVARDTDVSLGTVHDVSSRLRRGISPELDGHRAPARAPAPVAVPAPGPAGPPVPYATPREPAERADALTAAADVAPRRRNHIDAPVTWPGVAAKMAKDPTIRYTEAGKEFLQWMALHASDPDGWREFVSSIPAHWQCVIAPIAESIGREWSTFAERLKATQEAV